MKARLLMVLMLALWLLSSCTADQPTTHARICRVVLEQSDAFTAAAYVTEATVGDAVSFVLVPQDGWQLTDTNVPEAMLLTSEDGKTVRLTLPAVRYSTVVSVQAMYGTRAIIYDSNGLDLEQVKIPDAGKHQRINTATALFDREGYTQLGWSTASTGDPPIISLGSRVSVADGEQLTLYAVWAPWAA